MPAETSGSSSLVSFSPAPRLAPPPSFPSTPPPYPQIRHTNAPSKLPLFSDTLPTPFSSKLIRTCPFKIKSSEDPEAKLFIS